MQKGFTIVELIISMFIVVVLASMVTVAFNYNQQHKVLEAQGRLFLNVLKEAQSKSLTGVKNSVTKKVPDGGWGVRIDGGQYVVFSDENSSGTLNVGEAILTGDLGKNLKFTNTLTDIVFLPYKTIGSVCWNGSCAEAAVKMITIENEQNGELFLIYIDPAVGTIFNAE